ncbi:MAG: serine--tRNA ligase [Parachlamydiaceae bacterium]
MLDIRLIRKDKAGIEEKLKRKDPSISLDRIFHLDEMIREGKTKVEALKAERNEASKSIGEMKRQGKDISEVTKTMGDLASLIQEYDEALTMQETEFNDLMSRLPNIPYDNIKVSMDPKENVEVKSWGKKREFDFPFKNHLELNEALQLFDFKRGAKISGAGWPVYKQWGARLEWALLQYMISIHIKNGFSQWIPPIVVRPEILYASGQLPKFANQQFRVHDDDFNLFLIPTAEVSLNGLMSDEVVPEEELPLKFIAYTPCFRREAGAAGEKERGLIRTHQFNKVEMFCFTKPDDAERVFEEMMKSAEEILQGLELHYRNMLLVTGDMSFAGAKTIDIEVWLPGQNRYYEVSSVTNCTDYQSRRSNIRFKGKEGKPEFLYTLNGSGLATSRLMVSLLENNQNSDGSVTVPKVLRPYLGGIEKLTP